MDRLIIEGGHRLHGTVSIAGAKNAALPLMVASLLSSQETVLHNVPQVADIVTMHHILSSLGMAVRQKGNTWHLDGGGASGYHVPYDSVRKMRASILLLSALLARHGKVRLSLPGGCAIGVRPVNWHLAALQRMGAHIDLRDGIIEGTINAPFNACTHMLPMPSVGTTETIMMAAVMAKGRSVIINGACEPEIVNLAHCLNGMGARIEGAGSSVIAIDGVTTLHGTTHEIIPDRIEAASYAFAVAATGGDVKLKKIDPSHLRWLSLLEAGGVTIEWGGDTVRLRHNKKGLHSLPQRIRTAPYPAFATDLQAQWMALAAVSDGECVVDETIFDNRFLHVAELQRMGARITKESSHCVRVEGQGEHSLRGAPVMASDLRASMGLVIAALAARGTSIIHRLYHLDRGYDSLASKLHSLGAKVTRTSADATHPAGS